MTSSTVFLYVIAGELGLLLLPEILWGSRWSRRVSVVVSCRRPTLGLVFLLVLVRLVIVEAMARRAERRRRRKWSVRISVSSVVHPQNLTTKKTLLEIHKLFFFTKKKKKKKPHKTGNSRILLCTNDDDDDDDDNNNNESEFRKP
jgi:hypothetical protein